MTERAHPFDFDWLSLEFAREELDVPHSVSDEQLRSALIFVSIDPPEIIYNSAALAPPDPPRAVGGGRARPRRRARRSV